MNAPLAKSAPAYRAGFVTLVGGGRIAYTCHGEAAPGSDAPPLLLLRPLGGASSSWGTFRERVASRRMVVAFDPRGVGASSDMPLFHSTRRMAADAKAVLDTLGIDRADVFGLSLGGMVATWLAIDAPERVRKLVLAGVVPRARARSRSPRLRHRIYAWARAALTLAGGDLEPELVRHVLSHRFRNASPRRVEEILRTIRDAPASRRNLALLALAAIAHDTHRHLAAVRAPVLLLYGALDPIAGRRSRDELMQGLSNAELVTIDGAGHDLSLEAPEHTARVVDEWLRATT